MSRDTESKDPALAAIVCAVLGFISLVWSFVLGSVVSGGYVADAVGGLLHGEGTTAAPAAPAFAIWWLLYFGFAGYLIWQVLPRNRALQLHRQIRPWVLGSIFLNALWLQMLRWDQLGLSVVVMLVLVAVLTTLVRLISTQILFSATDRWITRATFGFYYGWILLTAIGNISAWLNSLEHPAVSEALKPLTALLILLTGLAICAMTFKNPMGIYVNTAALWAIGWIAAARFNGPLYSASVALCACVAGALLLICLLSSVRKRIRPLLREAARRATGSASN